MSEQKTVLPGAIDAYMRLITLFDQDATAASFLSEDGDGGFVGGVYRMAREIERLREDRDYWKTEAAGETAKVNFRDQQITTLRAALVEERKRALEEAAFVLECKAAYFSALPWQSGRHKEVQQRYRDDAAAIRALKEKP